MAVAACKNEGDNASSTSGSSRSSWTIQTGDGGTEEISDLGEAVEWGKLDAVNYFLDKGVDVNAPDFRGDTPLHKTATIAGDQVEIARILIEHGANVNAVNKRGSTPLHQVSTLGNPELVHALVENGADVNRLDNEGHTALDYAIYAAEGRDPKEEPGFGYVIQYLTQYGTRTNKRVE